MDGFIHVQMNAWMGVHMNVGMDEWKDECMDVGIYGRCRNECRMDE